jgi:hypothetical protein
MGKVIEVVIHRCEEPSRNMWATPAEYVVLLNRYMPKNEVFGNKSDPELLCLMMETK